MMRGRWDSALSLFNTEVSLRASAPEPEHHGLFVALANVYRQKGDFPHALECLHKEEEVVRGIHNVESRDLAEGARLRALANLYDQMGDAYHALRAEMQAAWYYLRSHNEWTAGASWGNIAEHYAELGDYEHATEAAQRSYLSGRRFNDPSEQERNLENLASFDISTGQLARARVRLEKALTFRDRVYTPSFEANAWLSLSELEANAGRTARAKAYADRAIRILDETDGVEDRTRGHVQLGHIFLASGELDQARAEFEYAQRLGGCESCVISSHRGMAEILRRRGDVAGALEELKSAMTMMDIQRSRIAAPDLRTTFEADGARVFEDALSIIGTLRDRPPAGNYDREALEISEKAKARSFLDQLAESNLRQKPILSPDESQRYNDLQLDLSKAHSELLRIPSVQNGERMRRAEQELNEWTMLLRDRHPELSRFERPLKADEIETFVRRNGITAIEFALGGSGSFAWVINAAGIRMMSLPPRAVIEEQVRAFRELVQKPPSGQARLAEYKRRAYRLYRMLGGETLSSGKRTIIVPDGILHYVPFQALTTSYRGGYLLDQNVISYAPSVSALIALEHRSSVPPQKELIAYGDPWFGPPSGLASQRLAMRVRDSYSSVGLRLGALPGTRIEVEEIGNLYSRDSRKIMLGRQASEESVKTEHLGDYRRIHFATHAIIDERVPSRSGIVLSLAGSGDEDGILRRTEIMELKLNADLVVLSACESGLGKLVRGEGIIGLTSAFLSAGARHVAVSLWPVNDTSTADLMKDFYVEMNRGADPAAALRAAQLKMLRSPQRAWRHPYFWAAFVLSGSQ